MEDNKKPRAPDTEVPDRLTSPEKQEQPGDERSPGLEDISSAIMPESMEGRAHPKDEGR
jgi:hypothetical protein